MDYCISSFRKRQEALAYKIYVTDALKLISENTARFGGGSQMSKRFYDIINPQTETPQTSTEVISRIRKKIGGGKA